MNLTAFLQRHVPTLAAGLRRLKNRQFEVVPPRLKFAPQPLHRFITERFGSAPGVFFEVGANDGLTQSNTAYLERYCGWRGILVEAIPHKYVECKKNRPLSQSYHAALVAMDHASPVVSLRYSNLMSVAETVSETDVEAHLETGAAFLGTESEIGGETFYAPARTVSQIVAASGHKTIDLFSLDVEGAEMDVLAGIDFSLLRPRNFIIEVRDIEQVTAFLHTHGYVMEQKLTHHDYLFVDARPQH